MKQIQQRALADIQPVPEVSLPTEIFSTAGGRLRVLFYGAGVVVTDSLGSRPGGIKLSDEHYSIRVDLVLIDNVWQFPPDHGGTAARYRGLKVNRLDGESWSKKDYAHVLDLAEEYVSLVLVPWLHTKADKVEEARRAGLALELNGKLALLADARERVKLLEAEAIMYYEMYSGLVVKE